MPLLIFDMIEGRTETEIINLMGAAHEAVVEALQVPEEIDIKLLININTMR